MYIRKTLRTSQGARLVSDPIMIRTTLSTEELHALILYHERQSMALEADRDYAASASAADRAAVLRSALR